MKCKMCGSHAINPHMHHRDGSDLDLCDVCYWRVRAQAKALCPGDYHMDGDGIVVCRYCRRFPADHAKAV